MIFASPQQLIDSVVTLCADRHVWNYMAEIGIARNTRRVISTLNRYLVFETALLDHAKTLGHSVGILDWAIWIVMRQARKPNLEFIFE